MRLKDLTSICIHNLFRHRSRTLLTVLGVIVGCCSVVIMISFGIAMKISQESMLEEMGDLTIIEVSKQRDNVKLNDNVVQSIEAMEGVDCVNPKMTVDTDVRISTGAGDRYLSQYVSIAGMRPRAVEAFGYTVSQGKEFGAAPMEVLAGKYFAYRLMDTQRPEGFNTIDYWSAMYDENGNPVEDSELPKPYVDPLNSVFKITLGASDDSNNNLTKEFKIVGILEEDYSKGYETSEGLIFKEEDLRKLMDEFYQLNNISGKKDREYGQLFVKVKDINSVSDVENQIKEMGFYTYSLASIRESIEKDVRQKQLMFAGLGVVSLFVAALGIMNTMIMAISERKKEIGVMKALGCFINNIRTMFLMEAGFIGLTGGVLGAIISLLVSGIINVVSTQSEITDWEVLKQVLFYNTDRISVVPVWLAASAIVFSVLVGVLSGLYPANSAIKISALEAIRAE